MPAVSASRPPRPAPRASDHAARSETPYERYVRTFPEGMKGDLINGEAVIDMSASLTHERIQLLLLFLIHGFAGRRKLGTVLGSRTLMRVDDDNAFEPDVLFVRSERLDIVTEQAVVGAVDLAVEIVSPSSGTRDRETKFGSYQRLGVPEYWLVDPTRGDATFYRLGEDGQYRAVPLSGGVFESVVLPGFRLDPRSLFDETYLDPLSLLQAMLAAAGSGGEDAG